MLTVWMSGQVTPEQLAQIRATAPGADVRHFASQGELEAQIEEAEVVAGNLSPAALARAEKLKWGQDLALKCKAFHMRTLGLRRTPVPTPHIDELFTHDRLHDLLAQSDFVVVTAPRTPETVGMLGEAEFRAMKPTAHYICFSRGGIADDAALLRALQEGWIAGGGLDAHDQEPLPPDSPFWSLPNAIVTPHNGATTPQTRQRGVDIFVENLRRYQEGRELVNVIDKGAGY